MDFDEEILKKAIRTAYQKQEVMRLRLVKINKETLQYIEDYEDPEINVVDFSKKTKEDENKLFDFLQFQYGIIQTRTTTANFNPIVACTQMQYDLLLKYNIVQANDRDLANLLCNKITLNQLLQSQAFKNIADDRFTSFVTLLFGTGTVNLRNDLAHCNTAYSNYYSIHITALLFALFTMVSDESFLK